MHRFLRTARGRVALGVLALAGLAAGAAYAAIPDAAGVIHGCYRTSTGDEKGQLRVVEDPASCRSNETPIQWNQQGEAGPQGPPGPPGADGQDGEDGEPFSGTFRSPNGQFSLTVSDTGIVLGGGGSTIVLGSAGIQMLTAQDITITSGRALTATAATALGLGAGGSAFVEVGGNLALRGASVHIGPGATCRPAARIGDAINGVATSGAVNGTITSGSTSVCVG
jgi:hypothetical protein